MALSVMELQLGVFGFLLTTHAEAQTNASTIKRVYLYTHTAVHSPWRIKVIFTAENPEYPQLEPHVGIKMMQVLGSPVYICGEAIAPQPSSSFMYGGHLNKGTFTVFFVIGHNL